MVRPFTSLATVGPLTNYISHVTTISPFISHHRTLFHTASYPGLGCQN